MTASTLESALPAPVRDVLRRPGRRANVSGRERFASIAAGSGLLAFGLTRRHKIPGTALVMIGAGLVWRGVTGHCDVYALLGIDRAGHAAASPGGEEATDRSGGNAPPRGEPDGAEG